MHDFAAISLSDRLTPWNIIEKRLEAAAMSDLVIVLYNPKSKGRQDQLKKAVDLILKWRSPQTPVGIVRAAMREDENVVISTLDEMTTHPIDMQTTVIIGNSQSLVWNRRMITPRGYENKFKI
jgi:precorrin-3B C17-methyltransferase